MKMLMAATLVLFGAFWLFNATINRTVVRTNAISNAMQLEADLKKWAITKVDGGRLRESDVIEIFPEEYSLRFGGESRNRNFREMVSDIAQSGVPPLWPGVLVLLIGCLGAYTSVQSLQIKQIAEQDAALKDQP
ncbi:hypothetical protein JIN85_19995 [Luteolibacter pohnpeiensis]|uniref:Uncharacterized protein n=1 Tax=Luteolibacter pohnpeiensis TaxID=454153 RepID=A0A934VYN3_9BACT|nr:hypothetical protein [Luteolibacter pohnpeiensis]MBK1884704.1 hypothetical protein [Luteolibacter pohnpeiensis]